MEFREMVGHSFGSTLIDGRQEEAGAFSTRRGTALTLKPIVSHR